MNENKNVIPFVKMHGAGNDYVYINALNSCPENLSQWAVEISDRHFGVGSDGLIAILPADSDEADFRMEMYNADGSRGKMCGNASRCIAKFLIHYGLTDKKMIRLATDAGVKFLYPRLNDTGEVMEVTVDMGIPEFTPDKIPVKGVEWDIDGTASVSLLATTGEEFKAFPVSMGNPHAVIILNEDSDLTDHLVLECGKEFEKNPAFPDYANIEFIKVRSKDDIQMRVWERGSGETLACGTGACASVVAGIAKGLLNRRVRVHLKGGILQIEWDEKTGHVMMTGGAEIIAEGIYFRKNLH